MRTLLALLGLVFLSFGVNPKDDMKELKRIGERLDSLERSFREKGVKLESVDELNRLGYPIHLIYERSKYLKDKDSRYEGVYEEAKALKEKYFLIKREIFPHFVKEDAKRNNLSVCSVEVTGKDKRKIIVRIENPESDEEIRKVFENTQLYYADRLGFEVIDFRKCKE